MSDINTAPAPVPVAPSPNPAPTPEPAVSKGALPNNGLPDSAVFQPKPDNGVDKFFDEHQRRNSGAPAAPAVAQVPAAVAAPKPEHAPAAPKADDPKPTSIAQRLAAKHKAPAPAQAAEPIAPAPGSNPEDNLALYSDVADPKPNTPAAQWREMKTITKGLRDQVILKDQKIHDLEAQIAAAKSGTATPDDAEIARLREEHRQMSDKLAIFDLREHPDFRRTVLEPKEAALAEASAILKASGVDVDPAALLHKSSKVEFLKSMGEAIKTLSVPEQYEATQLLRTAYDFQQKEAVMSAKARETYGALRQQGTDRQKRIFEQTWMRASAPITEHLVELEVPDNATPEQRKDVEDFNKSVQGLRNSAEQIAFGTSDPEGVANAAIKAAAYDLHVQKVLPRVLSEYEGLLKLNAQMAEQLKAIRDRNPNRAGAPAGVSAGGPSDPQDVRNMSHEAAADALYRPRSR